MCRALPVRYLTPLRPPPAPFMRRLRNVTTSVGRAATLMPLVPDARTLATCPPPPSIVRLLVIVSAPKPPGSRASISPPGAVFEIAPANVLHGAVRLHGLASSPTPDTQVRVWACAALDNTDESTSSVINVLNGNVSLDICVPLRRKFCIGGRSRRRSRLRP